MKNKNNNLRGSQNAREALRRQKEELAKEFDNNVDERLRQNNRNKQNREDANLGRS